MADNKQVEQGIGIESLKVGDNKPRYRLVKK
jgi:hypothetical protein